MTISRRHLIAAAAPAALLAGLGGRAMSRASGGDKPQQPARATDQLRRVSAIFSPPAVHWVGDGFRVNGYANVVPDVAKRLSPFLLLDYAEPFDFPPSEKAHGVGVHPHRGFETVTLAFQGSVAHHDSTGAGGVIGPGDVQWMTAASGILHKEYHEAAFAKRGGTMQMAQLWVNLPRVKKMSAPGYQPIVASQMGQLTLPKGAGQVRVISGELAGVKGPARTHSRVHVFDAKLAAGGKLDLPMPGRENLAVLVMDGELALHGGVKAKKSDFVVFENEGRLASLEATSPARLLVLGGEPIDEPVVQYGPFAMNTKDEIRQAYADLREGRFGTLAD